MQCIRFLFASLLIVASTACTDDNDDGLAPTIGGLTYSPAIVGVGQNVGISGTVTFDDPDGDLFQLAGSVRLPNGTRQDIAPDRIENVVGLKSGTLTWTVSLRPVQFGGAHAIDLHVEDAAGHASNTVTATVVAQ